MNSPQLSPTPLTRRLHQVRALPVLVLALSWLSSIAAGAAAAPPASTNEVDRAACERQLRIIHRAIVQYRTENRGNAPDRLSDLVPAYLHDPRNLTCPYVARRGGLRGWKKRFNEISPDAHTSYSYEIAPIEVGSALWRGLPKITYRDIKERLQRELEAFGPVVPIVRCHDHRPWLNLTTAGKVYESGEYWERNFTTNDDLLTISQILWIPGGRAPGPSEFAARDPRATARQLDLGPHYNATLTNEWLGFGGSSLSALPTGLQKLDGVDFDVRGIVQLAGSEFPSRFPYPNRIEGISVRQRCRRVHFLHALSVRFRKGSLQATYQFNYADGQSAHLPLFSQEQISDWWINPTNRPVLPGATIAWIGENKASQAYQMEICLYHTIWENPRPDIALETISIEQRQKPLLAGTFIIAITLE